VQAPLSMACLIARSVAPVHEHRIAISHAAFRQTGSIEWDGTHSVGRNPGWGFLFRNPNSLRTICAKSWAGTYRALMTTWTVFGEVGAAAGGTGQQPVLGWDDLARVTGWAPKPQGWCRGEVCIPAASLGALAGTEVLAAVDVARGLGSAFAVDVEHRLAVVGPRADHRGHVSSGVAPDVALAGLDGDVHQLFEDAPAKALVLAFASWCGCRYDLPGWQRLADELAGDGFGIVGVAIDESVADAAPWAEPVQFPVLVDTTRAFADAYGLVNVPTVFWVGEHRQLVRAPSTEFPDDSFTEIHGVRSGPHLDAVRAWVHDDVLPEPVDAASLGALTADQCQARAEFRLALELSRRGLAEAAAARVTIADSLAPDDFTIWRAGMQLVGQDPFGAAFFERYQDWQQRHGGPLRTSD
jgi:peroxiredoxin